MFHRVFIDHWMTIFPLVAFVTAATIYAWMAVKTIRMPRAQIERFASLPFNEDLPAPPHDAQV